jgi:UDP-glucose 4-epimerase
MKILITGGSGFIGTHLTQELLRLGHEIRVFDLKGPNPGDIRDPASLKAALLEGYDFVFHLAAIVSVPECEGDPEGSSRTNLEGTLNVANALLASPNPGAPLVFASSAAVYGDRCGPGDRLSESVTDLEPLSHYGRQKLEAEEALRALHRTRGLRALSFRFFNVYGQGQDPTSPYSGVITRFREALRTKTQATLFNGGKNTRDFIPVTEIVRGCGLALSLENERFQAQSVNLCTGSTTSVLELYRTMCAETGAKFEPILAGPRAGDIEHSCGDPSLAETLLGFRARTVQNKGFFE